MDKLVRKTSFEVFMSFVKTCPETGGVDASDILGRPCFQKWLKTRSARPKNPPRAFKDAIKTIILATNRCRPFPPEVEESLLGYLRKERVWPCFEDQEGVKIGKRGWKIIGFHERKSLEATRIEIEMPEPTVATIDINYDQHTVVGSPTNDRLNEECQNWDLQANNSRKRSFSSIDCTDGYCNKRMVVGDEMGLLTAVQVVEYICSLGNEVYNNLYHLISRWLEADVTKMMQQRLEENDRRFDVSFIASRQGEWHTETPTGYMQMLDTFDCRLPTCILADPVAKSVFGEQIESKQVPIALDCELYRTYVSYIRNQVDVKGILENDGVVWSHAVVKTKDQVKVVRMHLSKFKNTQGGMVLNVTAQDVSQEYPEMTNESSFSVF
mmetsp:Transcript_25096/g.54170  ORF Transcript_25096/g.54170 Transcript_25096/m.54170 type:complete len:382 (+) Transcript_25096:471-1616(+)